MSTEVLTRTVKDIIEKLPEVGYITSNSDLLEKIMAKYKCSQMIKHHYFVMQPVQGVGIKMPGKG